MLHLPLFLTDIRDMSMVSSIANLSVAKSLAETQMAVATKVMKMAMNQNGKAFADLVSQAAENMQEAADQFTEAGRNLDTFA